MPLGNLLNRLVGVAVALTLLAPIGRFLVFVEPDISRAVADFHTLFNLVLAAVFLPILPFFASLLRRLLPPRINPADPARPLYLDPVAIETPIAALGGAAREALRLADVLETMFQGLRDSFERDDRRLLTDIKRQDDLLDKLSVAIAAYLTTLDPEMLTDADHRRLSEILAFATNLKDAGDVVDRNLVSHAARRIKRGLAFSREGRDELIQLVDRLLSNLRAAAALFVTGDTRAARLLAGEKNTFRDIESQATSAHFERLRAGRTDTAESSTLHLETLRDLARVNGHQRRIAGKPAAPGHL